MAAKILYSNKLLLGTLYSSQVATGYAVDNVLDEKTFTYWKAAAGGSNFIRCNFSGAQAIDCVAIVGHNLHTVAATVTIEASSDGTTWGTVGEALTPATDDALMICFDSESYQYWRVSISSTGAPMIAVLFMGLALNFEYPANTPFDIIDEGINATEEMSKGGNLLGVTFNYNDFQLARTFTDFTRTWFTSSFLPFWDTCGKLKKNFFYVDDYSYAPTLVYYGRFTNDFRLKPGIERLDHISNLQLTMLVIR